MKFPSWPLKVFSVAKITKNSIDIIRDNFNNLKNDFEVDKDEKLKNDKYEKQNLDEY